MAWRQQAEILKTLKRIEALLEQIADNTESPGKKYVRAMKENEGEQS